MLKGPSSSKKIAPFEKMRTIRLKAYRLLPMSHNNRTRREEMQRSANTENRRKRYSGKDKTAIAFISLTGMLTLGGCSLLDTRQTTEQLAFSETPSPLPCHSEQPETLQQAYWALIATSEEQTLDSAFSFPLEIVQEYDRLARRGDLLRCLEILRREWEYPVDHSCDSYCYWIDGIKALAAMYSAHGSADAPKNGNEDVRLWFDYWTKVYRERAEKGDLIDRMRYYFWPANGMEAKERQEYFPQLRRLYAERTGKSAPKAERDF